MGYRPERNAYRLVFEDPAMDGLVVRMKSVPVGQLMAIQEAAESLSDADDLTPADLGNVASILEIFADALLEWNVEDEVGAAVPPTLEGVKTQEVMFIAEVMKPWLAGHRQVQAPPTPLRVVHEPEEIDEADLPVEALPY